MSEPEAHGPGAEGPEPLGIGLPETGDPGVDALIARLTDADALPTEGHVAVYEDVLGGLRETLAALDSRPGPPPPSPGAPGRSPDPAAHDDDRS